MKEKTLLGAVLVLALVLTACAPATPATEPVVPDVATEPAVTGVATEPLVVTGEATVNVSESADLGSILVDGEGMSLYAFMQDTQDSGISTCTDADGCLVEWPALASQGAPVAGEGVDTTLLSTITRDDGLLQVTYNGWPLYLFVEDTAPGDTNGQGIDEFGGLWFLVSPTGEVIQE